MSPDNSLRRQLSRRMMLDLRLFGETQATTAPLTQLPTQWRDFLKLHPLAGVVLFAENISTVEQCIALTASLREASSNPRMLIGIDQEGGRVMRTPRGLCTDFAGPMAMGAAAAGGMSRSQAVATAMGLELQALGINLNFAPTVDVNSNPANPVINVRAFGESVELVCSEGGAFTAGLQTSGVGAVLKHFPGHGDTHSDSHIGLPRVDRNEDEAFAIDLAPYRHLIARQKPAAIMTAHIQYPSLDNSPLVDVNGQEAIRPATLSRRILSELLRDKLEFQGCIITDALDMGAIAENFDLVQATLESLAAGADILLMPFRIERPADFIRFEQFLDELVAGVVEFPSIQREMSASIARIEALEALYPPTAQSPAVIRSPSHLALETELAQLSICSIGEESLDRNQAVVVSGSSAALVISIAAELELMGFDCLKVQPHELTEYLNCQLVWVELSPNDSAVDWGGADFTETAELTQSKDFEIVDVLSRNRFAGGRNWFLAMRSPYINPDILSQATVLFSYHYSTAVQSETKRALSPVYKSLAEIMSGERKARGSLPVSVG